MVTLKLNNMVEISIEDKFLMKVSFLLRQKQGNKSQIWLYANIYGKRAMVFTKIVIEPTLWQKADKKTGRMEMAKEDKSLGSVRLIENKNINKRLKNILGYCYDYASLVVNNTLTKNAIPHNADVFKEYLNLKINKNVETNKRMDAQSFIENYIERKPKMLNKDTRRLLAHGTIYNHKNSLRRLLLFCDAKHVRLSWRLFDSNFEEIFTSWMVEKGYTPNTIASQYSVMKVWLSQAELEGYEINKAIHKYPTKVYNVDNIYLTEIEIEKLYNLDFSSEVVKQELDYCIQKGGQYEQTRDLFCFACWTGLRYNDWSNIMDVAVFSKDNEFATVHTRKTNVDVIIPLHPMVKAILRKYGGVLPKAVDKSRSLVQIRKLAALAGIDEMTTICKVKGGRSIISRAPKYQFICNHTSRRSFATNAYLKGIPTMSIMAITGHTSEENFMKYIKIYCCPENR